MTAPVAKRRAGRPALPPGERRAAIFSVRLSAVERAAVEAAAKRSGEKASDWARAVILAALNPAQT